MTPTPEYLKAGFSNRTIQISILSIIYSADLSSIELLLLIFCNSDIENENLNNNDTI